MSVTNPLTTVLLVFLVGVLVADLTVDVNVDGGGISDRTSPIVAVHHIDNVSAEFEKRSAKVTPPYRHDLY